MNRISLLRAAEDDKTYVWSSRNDAAVRGNFFNSDRIPWETHTKWYEERLHDANTAIYIARYGKNRIGVIRFEKKKNVVLVSVHVNSELIGKGLGSEIIRLGTERYYAETKKEAPVIAEIKSENIASQKAFQKAGYRKKAAGKAKITFIKSPEDMYIYDKEIRLRPLQKEHINKRYLNWLNDPDITRFLETKKSTEKELKDFYQRILNNMNTVIFAIEVRKKHIGNAKLEINWKHKYASFGIMIGDKKQWGRGYGTRTAQLIADYAFNRLGMYAVTLGVYGNHTSAIKAYEKAGFMIRGRQPEMLDFEGNRVDKVIMGISLKEFCGSNKR